MDINFEVMREPGFFTQVIKKRQKDIKSSNKHAGWRSVLYCPICRNKKNNTIMYKTDYSNYINCATCDCAYSDNIPQQQNIGRFTISNTKTIEALPEEKKREYRRKRFAVERVNIIKKYLKKPLKQSSLLDIGCNTGFFLEEAKSYFNEIEGHEKDVAMSKYTEEKFNIKTYTCDLCELNKTYDVITLFDVVEHIEQPLLFLKDAKKLLKSKGIMLIYTPNYRSLSFEILGKNCNHLYPGHVVMFSKKTVEYITKKLNMDLLLYQTCGMDWFDILAYERDINGIDIKKSALYKKVNQLQQMIDEKEEANSLRFLLKKR